MATATKKKSRSRYSDAKVAAAKARDAHVEVLAQALPEDDADLDPRVNTLPGAKVMTYSLRNRALLLAQADELGIQLTEVDSFAGWCQRGRVPNQPGMRINRFRGEDEETKPADADPAPAADKAKDTKPRQRFGKMSVWDVSQTKPLDDADQVGGGAQ